MALLLLFALMAGAGTALSPCVLPVLPVALSAGATGGRRRPLGIATGLALSFTFATVALVYLIDALGLPDDLLRTVAIVVLVLFGVSLLVPPVSARIEAFLQRLAPKPREGIGSGFLLGFALGFVYAPCAGPILAGVITVSAAQSFTAGRVAVALAYGIGSAIALYALMLGGRRFIPKGLRVQQAMGGVMVVIAVLMFANVDTRFQTAIADDLPDFLVDPARPLENKAKDEVAEVRGKPSSAQQQLSILGTAPEIGGTQKWFNSRPRTLRSLRGRVVLVDFWTYTCINCIRTLPHLKSWDARYRRDGLTVLGIHTPEFPFEKDAGNVGDAVAQNGIKYPVAQDNDMSVWNAFGNQYWPAEYLIDRQGRVRHTNFGEGKYGETEAAIRSLLGERGPMAPRASAQAPSEGLTTPETYLGAKRAEGWVKQPVPGVHTYTPSDPPPDSFAYGGNWRVTGEDATAGRGARIDATVGARRAFLVMGSPGRARTVRVLLDGKPYRTIRVRRQTIYPLVNLPRAEQHRLTLQLAPGISGYAFTFG